MDRIAILKELNKATKEAQKLIVSLKRSVLALRPLPANEATEEAIAQLRKTADSLDRLVDALVHMSKAIG